MPKMTDPGARGGCLSGDVAIIMLSKEITSDVGWRGEKRTIRQP